ncbi:MAG: TonB-dependent receptor [Verrucomicrobia bacterium]|nr:TonB-dependent receptor [Verrucomicrobiota bacterium]
MPTVVSLRRSCFAVLLAVLPALAPVFGQTSPTGSITGRVLNVGTGKYLNNARITVEGTNLEELTNEFGEFRLTGVPAGPARVRATYTGLDAKVTSVNVTAGGTTTADFNLTSAARYGQDETVRLDTFTVAAQREFEGAALATNEQRYAPNVKVVMAADSFGDVTEGNVGEFLKYLPGITVDYVAADVRTVSVRGFADTFTNVSIDGMRTTSSVSGNSNRVFEFEQVSINNASRVEVTKVPTPENPADSLGGSVNMVSKNAFERKGAQLNYRVSLNFNSEDTQVFKKTPGPGNKPTYKVLPGFDFDYTLPVTPNFGLVITGLNSNQFNEQHRWQPTWNYAQAGATAANPYLQQWQIQDGPKNTFRTSVSVKADWRITPRQVLSLGVQDNYYDAFFGNRNLNFNVGTNQVPTPATGTPLQWGQTFVQSATGRASVTQGSSFRAKLGDTKAVNLKYTFRGDLWDTDAGLHGAKSKTWYRELARGHFSNVGTQLQGVSVVRADNISFPSLTWVARDVAGNAIDPYNLANYRLNTLQNSPVDGKAVMKGGFVNTKRNLDLAGLPLHLKAGVSARQELRDNRRYTEQWNFLGADGVANTADDSAGPFLDTSYIGQDPLFGSPPIQWMNPYKLADLYKSNPAYFRGTTSTITVDGASVTTEPGYPAELARITNSQRIQERITAAFVQVDGKALDNRLHFVTGVRFEKTEDDGEGALVDPDAAFQRTAAGAFVRDTAGRRVLRPEAGAAGSLAMLRLTNRERAYRGSREYDGYYPSFHANYNVTDRITARFAYARTLGRPDYVDIIPTATIDDNEAADLNPALSPGTITLSNTALKPWTADNYDLSLEYYFAKGGMASVGVFQKNLANFWGNLNTPLTAELANQLGIEQAYIGWTVVTKVNVGSAKISGAEFNFNRQLDFLPSWGRYFAITANGTALHLQGANSADFNRFISKTGNFSLSWNRKPVSARVNFNYRGRQRNLAQTGAQYGATAGFYEYYDSRFNLDVNCEYTWSKRVRLFANARNILNQPQVLERYSATSARYATGYRHEEFGVQYTIGIKGTY